MKKTTIAALLFAAFAATNLMAQKKETVAQETAEIKAKYAMPLYLDLPGEMDVEKGYKEINLAMGLNSFKNNNTYRSLVEYAFAPVKRWGIEVELPFSFVHAKEQELVPGATEVEVPQSRLEGLRLGTMYTFAVLPAAKAGFSAGFFNEFEAAPFNEFGKPLFEGNDFNPFIAGAKVWGDHFHTMLYTGPSLHTEYAEHHTQTDWKINTTLSYQFGKRQNYAGVEVNQTAVSGGGFETILRPQVHIAFAEDWGLGIVASIPANVDGMNMGGFLRLIYMPKPRKR